MYNAHCNTLYIIVYCTVYTVHCRYSVHIYCISVIALAVTTRNEVCSKQRGRNREREMVREGEGERGGKGVETGREGEMV